MIRQAPTEPRKSGELDTTEPVPPTPIIPDPTIPAPTDPQPTPPTPPPPDPTVPEPSIPEPGVISKGEGRNSRAHNAGALFAWIAAAFVFGSAAADDLGTNDVIFRSLIAVALVIVGAALGIIGAIYDAPSRRE